MTESFDSDAVRIWFDNDFICGMYKKDTITLTDAKEIIDERVKLSKNQIGDPYYNSSLGSQGY